HGTSVGDERVHRLPQFLDDVSLVIARHRRFSLFAWRRFYHTRRTSTTSRPLRKNSKIDVEIAVNRKSARVCLQERTKQGTTEVGVEIGRVKGENFRILNGARRGA